MRSFYFTILFAAALPVAAQAQLEVSTNIGVHFDRAVQSERMLTDGSYAKFSARGEAPAVGIQGVYWTGKHFGVGSSFTVSQNRSWHGSSTEGSAAIIKRTYFTSLNASWRFFNPGSHAQFNLYAGPAAVYHGGSGESLLARTTDLGIVAGASSSLRLNQHFSVGIDFQNYRFRSDYRIASGPGGYMISPGEVHRRSEWLVLPNIRFNK